MWLGTSTKSTGVAYWNAKLRRQREKTKSEITSFRCRRAKESCACLIQSRRPLFLSNWKKNRKAWRRNLSHQRQTDRWGDRQPFCLPLWRNKWLSGSGSPLMRDYKSREAGSGIKKGRGRERTPPSLFSLFELWEAAGLEKAEGRKGSGDSLLFELCVLWLQSQRTLIQARLFISSQYPCRRRQAAAVFIIAYIMETLH